MSTPPQPETGRARQRRGCRRLWPAGLAIEVVKQEKLSAIKGKKKKKKKKGRKLNRAVDEDMVVDEFDGFM